MQGIITNDNNIAYEGRELEDQIITKSLST